MNHIRSPRHGRGHNKGLEIDQRRSCQERHGGEGKCGHRLDNEGHSGQENKMQKKEIAEEREVTIKWVKVGFQKVFRELAIEMVMSKVKRRTRKDRDHRGFDHSTARKPVCLEETCSGIRFGHKLK